MFGWFGSDESRGLEVPERLLFMFRDDRGVRRVDPLAAEAVLIEVVGVDWMETLSRQADDLDPALTPEKRVEVAKVVASERRSLIEGTDKAFGLRAYDPETGTGMLEIQRFFVLGQYMEYMVGLMSGGWGASG